MCVSLNWINFDTRAYARREIRVEEEKGEKKVDGGDIARFFFRSFFFFLFLSKRNCKDARARILIFARLRGRANVGRQVAPGAPTDQHGGRVWRLTGGRCASRAERSRAHPDRPESRVVRASE